MRDFRFAIGDPSKKRYYSSEHATDLENEQYGLDSGLRRIDEQELFTTFLSCVPVGNSAIENLKSKMTHVRHLREN
jgi:hypothetical protein